MGLGGYIFAEWHSVQEVYPRFKEAFRNLEARAIKKCTDDWFPKKTPAQACGFLNPKSGEQFGRTSILPALFDDHAGNPMNSTTGLQNATWRQGFTALGHQQILAGVGAGNTIPEDFKIAWIGLGFPNKNQHITEIRFQIGDRKYGRINLEALGSYNKPAVIFKKGFILNEEESFELYGYVRGPLPLSTGSIIYQRIIPLGAAYYKVKDKVLGNTGAAIT